MQSVDDQPVYRFMDLFELYDLAVKSKLKFTKLRLMPDKNEGLGEVLKSQAGAWGFQLRNERRHLKQAHGEFRECVYISCWTEEADAMAMWLLYSKEHSSFRIKTNLKKLRETMAASERDLFHGHYELEPGQAVPIMSELAPVKYVNFRSIHQRSKEKLEALDVRVRAALEKRDAGRSELEALLRSREDARLEDLAFGVHLKDEAYAHESEVRASFHLRIRNAMTVDELRQLPETPNNVLGFPMLDIPSGVDSPDVVHLPVAFDFIEEICFDPRMPAYKQRIVREMLGRDNSVFATSNAFGSLMDEVDLTIPEKWWE